MGLSEDFSPEYAWQEVLADLQGSMPRTAFDTWVKPTCLLNFDGDTFVIGCGAASCRDWLEARLTTTVQRFLSGVYRKEVKVRFVVCEPEISEEVPAPQVKPVPAENGDESLELTIQYNSIRNMLIEPGRVVRMPVYLLRWLPYVGAQIIFLVMAFWQEYYLTSGRNTRHGMQKLSVRAERVCQWAGISRAQFFRLLQNHSGLRWFVRKIETEYELEPYSGRMKKSSNQYELIEPSLTPGDAQDLKTFLVAHGIQNSPQTALQIALASERKSILQYPVRLPSEQLDNLLPSHLTVQNIIRELVGHRLNDELESMADQLADRLCAQGEFILVSWYFLKNWLPVLGADKAMFILILRNLCYFNDETGEIRDEVWMDGGYETIAHRLGLANSAAIATWFPAYMERKKQKQGWSERTEREVYRQRRAQELLNQFVERTDHQIHSTGRYNWKFKVQRVDPLIPSDKAVWKAVSFLRTMAEEQHVWEELSTWMDIVVKEDVQYLQGASGNGFVVPVDTEFETGRPEPVDATIVLRLSKLTKDCSETLEGLLKDCLETLDLADNHCFETLLKILKSLKDTDQEKDFHLYQRTGVETSEPLSPVVVSMGSQSTWSLEKLLARADRKNRELLLAQETSAVPFVSWVLYGASQPGIQNPYSLAIARLMVNPGVGAGGACERLAGLPRQKLERLIQQSLTVYFPVYPDWQMLFAEVKRERLGLLADSLGLVLNREETREPASEKHSRRSQNGTG